MKKVIIFHSPLADDAPADELDVLDEVGFFKQGLENLGYSAIVLPFPYNMILLGAILDKEKPEFIVNLVETIFADGKLVHIAPFLFDHFCFLYTGCTSRAIYLTSDKLLAKELMTANGISTPSWHTLDSLQKKTNLSGKAFIVKSIWEHASFGLDEQQKLIFDQRDDLISKLLSAPHPKDFFAEEYIHGREFNISLLESKGGVQVLPPAEIRFSYPPGKPRIVGYRAKWDENSFEFANTTRSFEFNDADSELLSCISEISVKCWRLFGLRGYARIDFRVDMSGNIFVLEINANPCISPDSGFVAAAYRAGLSQALLVKRIVHNIALQ